MQRRRNQFGALCARGRLRLWPLASRRRTILRRPAETCGAANNGVETMLLYATQKIALRRTRRPTVRDAGVARLGSGRGPASCGPYGTSGTRLMPPAAKASSSPRAVFRTGRRLTPYWADGRVTSDSVHFSRHLHGYSKPKFYDSTYPTVLMGCFFLARYMLCCLQQRRTVMKNGFRTCGQGGNGRGRLQRLRFGHS